MLDEAVLYLEPGLEPGRGRREDALRGSDDSDTPMLAFASPTLLIIELGRGSAELYRPALATRVVEGDAGPRDTGAADSLAVGSVRSGACSSASFQSLPSSLTELCISDAGCVPRPPDLLDDLDGRRRLLLRGVVSGDIWLERSGISRVSPAGPLTRDTGRANVCSLLLVGMVENGPADAPPVKPDMNASDRTLRCVGFGATD